MDSIARDPSEQEKFVNDLKAKDSSGFSRVEGVKVEQEAVEFTGPGAAAGNGKASSTSGGGGGSSSKSAAGIAAPTTSISVLVALAWLTRVV